MDVTINFVTQDWWTWWFAIYLFFGGMGAAVMAVAFLTDMYVKHHPNLAIWGMISSIVMLGLGSGMLFLHLLDHVAVINVLNPMVLLNKPDAWIAWGTQFITWMMIWGVLYPLPYLVRSDSFLKIPIIGSILRLSIVGRIAGISERFHHLLGWLAAINGIGVAVYTGLLLQSFPAVPLWHNPGVPVLFTISAFSTALAFLLLVLNVFIKDAEDHEIRTLYERLDVGLIAAELVVIFSFYQYLQMGMESAASKSFELLFSDFGWLVGFIGFGLIVPFFLELKGVLKGWPSHVPIVLASILVMIGGYLLRHYFMYAGAYTQPW
uniref:Formate-dependent nitrite reductase, membrane component NrfD n=2 Tax=unclassified Candidatus Kentrum TaxID=2643149 RepID=A0A451B487_9GAMM|nr:MAG: Formate-dependent nitrite reductase, membrane component NrfD [Candidatus Kentron sp. LPFa]VFK67736.1 MAG: Formate-dependent nitrite reductase, membrane component NrfD [Candidatus Kentron sp. UNK]VFK73093.1 MAG: Formate-dependent nitrite reductase, membrane component NrfD [Candidatus Kentron sp. UNK]